MRLTQYTDFSLRVLIYLGLAGEELTTIRAITDSYGISRSHVMKVVQKLSKMGYVTAIRGQGGGLRLGRPAAEIKLGALVRDMEPDFEMVECFREKQHCAIDSACHLPGFLDDAVRVFIKELDKHTLADLIPRSSSGKLIRLLNL